jgi:hypothetical protein
MPPAGGGPDVVPQHLVPVLAVVTSGMPGWQITLIAAGAALLAATVAVLLDRARPPAGKRSPRRLSHARCLTAQVKKPSPAPRRAGSALWRRTPSSQPHVIKDDPHRARRIICAPASRHPSEHLTI